MNGKKQTSVFLGNDFGLFFIEEKPKNTNDRR